MVGSKSLIGQVIIRRIGDSDSYEELTSLLHRSYAQLAQMGLRFFATHQTVKVTRERAEYGECYLALLDGQMVGTICFYPPDKGSGCYWYDKDGVAKFGQYAVEPGLQRKRIGRLLLETVERRSREIGAQELALDTAEGAHHLIGLYSRWGFRTVGFAQWEGVNYRSIIMSKNLTSEEAASVDS